MRKLRLELEALVVETFAPNEMPAERGTVRGHASLYWEDCVPSETCPGAGWPCEYTEQSCNGTCYVHTCQPSCGVQASVGCVSSICGSGVNEFGGPCSLGCPEQFA